MEEFPDYQYPPEVVSGGGYGVSGDGDGSVLVYQYDHSQPVPQMMPAQQAAAMRAHLYNNRYAATHFSASDPSTTSSPEKAQPPPVKPPYLKKKSGSSSSVINVGQADAGTTVAAYNAGVVAAAAYNHVATTSSSAAGASSASGPAGGADAGAAGAATSTSINATSCEDQDEAARLHRAAVIQQQHAASMAHHFAAQQQQQQNLYAQFAQQTAAAASYATAANAYNARCAAQAAAYIQHEVNMQARAAAALAGPQPPPAAAGAAGQLFAPALPLPHKKPKGQHYTIAPGSCLQLQGSAVRPTASSSKVSGAQRTAKVDPGSATAVLTTTTENKEHVKNGAASRGLMSCNKGPSIVKSSTETSTNAATSRARTSLGGPEASATQQEVLGPSLHYKNSSVSPTMSCKTVEVQEQQQMHAKNAAAVGTTTAPPAKMMSSSLLPTFSNRLTTKAGVLGQPPSGLGRLLPTLSQVSEEPSMAKHKAVRETTYDAEIARVICSSKAALQKEHDPLGEDERKEPLALLQKTASVKTESGCEHVQKKTPEQGEPLLQRDEVEEASGFPVLPLQQIDAVHEVHQPQQARQQVVPDTDGLHEREDHGNYKPCRGRDHATLEPHVWRNCRLGPCMERWKSKKYLLEKIGHLQTSFHENPTPAFDYRQKSFQYVTKKFSEILLHQQECDDRAPEKEQLSGQACLPVDQGLGEENDDKMNAAPRTSSGDGVTNYRGGKKFYYYRAVSNTTRGPAQLENTVPPLVEDFEAPEFLLKGRSTDVHSTVLRMCSQKSQIWLHYDVCDNLLCQVHGRKRVVLFHPCYIEDLCFDATSSSSALGSRLLTALSKKDWEALQKQFPKHDVKKAWEDRREVILEAGDTLLIPAFWLHCTEDLTPAKKETDHPGLGSLKKRRAHSSCGALTTTSPGDSFSMMQKYDQYRSCTGSSAGFFTPKFRDHPGPSMNPFGIERRTRIMSLPTREPPGLERFTATGAGTRGATSAACNIPDFLKPSTLKLRPAARGDNISEVESGTTNKKVRTLSLADCLAETPSSTAATPLGAFSSSGKFFHSNDVSQGRTTPVVNGGSVVRKNSLSRHLDLGSSSAYHGAPTTPSADHVARSWLLPSLPSGAGLRKTSTLEGELVVPVPVSSASSSGCTDTPIDSGIYTFHDPEESDGYNDVSKNLRLFHLQQGGVDHSSTSTTTQLFLQQQQFAKYGTPRSRLNSADSWKSAGGGLPLPRHKKNSIELFLEENSKLSSLLEGKEEGAAAPCQEQHQGKLQPRDEGEQPPSCGTAVAGRTTQKVGTLAAGAEQGEEGGAAAAPAPPPSNDASTSTSADIKTDVCAPHDHVAQHEQLLEKDEGTSTPDEKEEGKGMEFTANEHSKELSLDLPTIAEVVEADCPDNKAQVSTKNRSAGASQSSIQSENGKKKGDEMLDSEESRHFQGPAHENESSPLPSDAENLVRVGTTKGEIENNEEAMKDKEQNEHEHSFGAKDRANIKLPLGLVVDGENKQHQEMSADTKTKRDAEMGIFTARKSSNSEGPPGSGKNGGQEENENEEEPLVASSDELEMGISVNIFFRSPDFEGHYKAKDAWANHDFPVFVQATKALEKAVHCLDNLPTRAAEFYSRKLLMRCAELLAMSKSGPIDAASSNPAAKISAGRAEPSLGREKSDNAYGQRQSTKPFAVERTKHASPALAGA
ncbi:unnamed protein product [Amoebophrya sp. A120]|nr:unnamed protein product [Amoebophrya sp. A120]|eukprot:GSA120T00015009001.1